jgi:hypothetical protein
MPFPVSPDDIARLAREKRIPARRVGRRWQLTAAAVREARRLLGAEARAQRPAEQPRLRLGAGTATSHQGDGR